MGSLFSALQAIASPIIGTLSDKYGRRKALLISMCGNILSVLLWVIATDFRTFLLSRIVGGLSEGNVQIATSIATDISSDAQRGATMALVGACFCVCAINHGVCNMSNRIIDCIHIWPCSGRVPFQHFNGGSKPICNCSWFQSVSDCGRDHLSLHIITRNPSLPCIRRQNFHFICGR